MGQVFLGRSPRGRLVAVKVVRAELAGQAEFRTRFAREVAAAQKVSGLFTAPVVDADVGAPVPWLATAYVPGLSLAEAITGPGPLPATSVLALAAGLAEGLGAIHTAGIVHRDLKPPNVLLAEDGPRVIDFGISPGSGGELSGRALAWYSARLVSCPPNRLAATGSARPAMCSAWARCSPSPPPVRARSAPGPATWCCTGWSLSPRRTPAACPPNSGQLVERCLAKDPAQRPGTEQLLAELGTAPPASGWLPAPITQALPVHPLSEPLPAEPAAADVLRGPAGDQVCRAPRRRTRRQNADGDPGGYAAACRRSGARRPTAGEEDGGQAAPASDSPAPPRRPR